MDSVTIYPEEGNFPSVARDLLDAADHPSQVVTVSHPQAGFKVPEYVFERFEATRRSLEEMRGNREPEPNDEAEASAEAPKRRGRPRKVVPSEEE